MANDWQQELQRAVTSVDELLAILGLDKKHLHPGSAKLKFPLRVPRPYLARIRKGDASDPLLRQILPLRDEDTASPDYSLDPVNDLSNCRSNGILHKYHGRVLLIVTGACAIHCRYCFRQHFPYSEQSLGHKLDEALSYIEQDTTVEEVILSGGDPLSLTNARLFELCQRIEEIPRIQRIRVHTRLPIVVPSRIDNEFSHWLNSRKKHYLIVFHINHPKEIDDDVARAIARTRKATLLNQAVLLKGVNDSVETLAALSQRCFDVGILPYYLHLLDRVQGSAHFAVAKTRAHQLMRELAILLPGYLVPRLACDTGGSSKLAFLQEQAGLRALEPVDALFERGVAQE